MTRFISKNRNKIALLLSIILIGTAVLGGTLAYIIKETPSLQNIFIAKHYSNLAISKEVEHPLGENHTLPDDMEFKFIVNMGEEYKGKEITVQVSSNSEDNIVLKDADGDGCFELTLKADQRIKILNILDGTEVTVTEVLIGDYTEGFTVMEDEYTVENNPNAKTITIARGENELVFVNVYEPDPVPGSNQGVAGLNVDGKKIFEVPEEWRTEESAYTFTFGLMYKYGEDQDQDPVVLGGDAPTVTYTVIKDEETGFCELAGGIDGDRTGEEFSFDELLVNDDGISIFDKAGSYYFYAYEVVEENDPDIVYDMNLYMFKVVVADDDMDGYLEIKSIEGNDNIEVDGNNVEITFTNKHREYGSDTVRIDIIKEVKSDAGEKSPAGYTFELWGKDEDGEDKLIATSLPTNERGETSITLTYYGDEVIDGEAFVYTLKEVIPEDEDDQVPGIVYDETEWRITVIIDSNADGSDIDAELEEPEIIEKTNTTGQDAASDDEEETVTQPEIVPAEEDEDTEEEEPSEEDIITVDAGEDQTQQPAEGNAATSSSNSAASAAQKGITTVKSADNSNQNQTGGGFVWGQADDNSVLKEPIKFVNEYIPEAAEVTAKINVKKIFDGRELREDDEFTFKMYSVNNKSDFEEIVVNNDGEGEFEFDLSNITFDKIGTYEFVIEEVAGEQGGISYDTKKYRVIVEVKDNDSGKLTAEVTVKLDDEFDNMEIEPDEDGNYEVEFTNTYKAAAVPVVLEAEKKLKVIAGIKELKAGDFEFVILDKDGTEVEKVSNEADGTISFSEIEFTEAGTYTYTVKEVIPAANDRVNGVEYDDREYVVTVTVTDNGDGQLVAEIAYTEDGKLVDDMKFENKYNMPTVTPTPTPTPGDGPTPSPGTSPRPNTPAAPDDGSGVPPTGDNNNIGLYVTVMIASAAAITALVLTGRQQKGTAGRSKSKR